MKIIATYNSHYICKNCGELVEQGQEHTERECKRNSVERFIAKQIKKGVRKWTSIIVVFLVFIFLILLYEIKSNMFDMLVGMNNELLNSRHSDMIVIEAMAKSQENSSERGRK